MATLVIARIWWGQRGISAAPPSGSIQGSKSDDEQAEETSDLSDDCHRTGPIPALSQEERDAIGADRLAEDTRLAVAADVLQAQRVYGIVGREGAAPKLSEADRSLWRWALCTLFTLAVRHHLCDELPVGEPRPSGAQLAREHGPGAHGRRLYRHLHLTMSSAVVPLHCPDQDCTRLKALWEANDKTARLRVEVMGPLKREERKVHISRSCEI